MTNPDKETTEKMSDMIASTFQSVKHAFVDHPRKLRMNYCSHFVQSACMSFYMVRGAITLAIHAVFPFLLKNAYVVKQLHDEHGAPLAEHGAPLAEHGAPLAEAKEEEPMKADKSE